MTRYDKFISASLEALATWIDEHGQFNGSPWMEWFNRNYCSNCEPIHIKKEDSKDVLGFDLMFVNETTCSYCEVHHKCRYFPEYNDVISNCDIIKLWLQQEIEDE